VGDNKKVANSVVALSSAAVLAIYGTGYARTRAAADRFDQQASDRHPRTPADRGERQAVALDPADTAPVPSPITANDTLAPDSPTLPEQPPVAVTELKTDAKPMPVAPTRDLPAAKAPAVARESAPETTASIPVETSPAAPAGSNSAKSAAASESAQLPETPSTPPVTPAPAPAVPVPAQDTAKGLYKDGTYYGWGTSRHGDIQAAVVIESGRITVARVERCLTRYSCNWVDPIPPRILLKQSTTYDYVSGATESSDALQDAVSEALSQAK